MLSISRLFSASQAKPVQSPLFVASNAPTKIKASIGTVLALACLFGTLGASRVLGQGLLRNPSREVKVLQVNIEGNKTVDVSLIRRRIQVEAESTYLEPVFRQRIQRTVKALQQEGLFDDVRVEREDSDEGVKLFVTVVELPTLGEITYKGQDKIKKDDLKEKVTLIEGGMLSPSGIEQSRQRILDLYHEKGFLLATVEGEMGDFDKAGRRNLTFKIKEGKKVLIRYVTFAGNSHLTDKDLRKRFNMKEDRWWRSGDFKEDEYQLGLDTLVQYYRETGYLDASVVRDTVVYSKDKKHLDIHVGINEGRRYYFENAVFNHKEIVKDEMLKAQVPFDSAEVFDIRKYELMKYQITSLYREEGYLFVELNDRFQYRDSMVTVRFEINEKSIAHINLVKVLGNSKTKDKVVRREIKLFPGDIFRQSLMLRSQRDIMQLAFFDLVEPDIEPVKDGDKADVNLVFKLKEKEAGTGTFSAGAAYSARDGMVFTTGLQIPNFLGNGQKVDLNLEYGPYKRLGSIGFTEPWFMDTPTLVGGSVFYSQQYSQTSFENDFKRYGLRLNLGRRLTWPDDYFTLRGGYNLTLNDNGQGRSTDYLIVPSGLESSVNLSLIRDDKDLPFFPTEGSRYSLNYTKVGGPLAGTFDYDQYEAKINWWFPLMYKLTMGLESQFGFLNGDNIQSYALYQMGGMLGYQGKLRGYSAGTVGGGRIARSFFSFTTEFTYPVAVNTFYLVAFFDAGNAFGNLLKYDPILGYPNYNSIPVGTAPSPWEEIDFSDLRRDVGFGFRLVVPMVAPFGMGFDFGWPMDDTEDFRGRRSPKGNNSPEIQFVIEQGI